MKSALGLHDIQGLDSISWWPLAPGWWILFGVIVALVLAMSVVRIFRARTKRQWRHQVLSQLSLMAEGLGNGDLQTQARELSELMRRMAIYRFSRAECAHLLGDAWLTWLSEKDPKNIDWKKFSLVMSEVPYMGPESVDKKVELENLREAIDAAKGWVKSC